MKGVPVGGILAWSLSAVAPTRSDAAVDKMISLRVNRHREMVRFVRSVTANLRHWLIIDR
jgi:hypothetical protein